MPKLLQLTLLILIGLALSGCSTVSLGVGRLRGSGNVHGGKGLTYAQMGRFAVESGDPAGTNNADEALKDSNCKPVANQARNTQLTAAGLVTSLSLSAMAIGASYGAILLGVAFTLLGLVVAGLGYALLGLVVAGLGYALLGLITPEVAEKFGLHPVAA